MKDIFNFKGHFKIQSLDSSGNVTDEWEDDNLIMYGARQTISEMFAKTNQISVEKFILGTLGHTGALTNPKTDINGFVDTRKRLFSEFITVGDGAFDLKLGDCVKYIGAAATNNGTPNNYYTYEGSDDNVLIADTDFSNASLWTNLGNSNPYTYALEFDLPESVSGSCENILEDDDPASAPTSTLSTVDFALSDTSATFTINIPTTTANGSGFESFTEAALYANGRIFSMKTFRAKIKDNTIQLRIVWTITF